MKIHLQHISDTVFVLLYPKKSYRANFTGGGKFIPPPPPNKIRVKRSGDIAAMEYALKKDLTQTKEKLTQDVTDVDSVVKDDAGNSSTKNATLDGDNSVEYPTVDVDDVSEYLIPVNGY